MTTLFAMRGLSGSGKSTRAREIAEETDAVVINRDYLRMMLNGSWWTGKASHETRVSIAEETQVKAFLKAGISVVVDATHLQSRYLRAWARTASRHGAEFAVVDVIEDVATCRQRDHQRMVDGGRYVGDKVIEKQAKDFPVEKWPTIKAEPPFVVEPVEAIPGLPEALIVDIDGTLAIHQGRSPYDYTRVKEDLIDTTVRDLVNAYHKLGVLILIVSGRDDACYKDTIDWLNENGVLFDALHMRPAGAKDAHGNKLPDFVVKRDIFDAHIRGRFNILFCLDDRRQVIDNTWRAMGLKVLDVAGNEF